MQFFKCPLQIASTMKSDKYLLLMTLICILGHSVIEASGPTIDISRSDEKRKSRFVSFDTNSGKIEINLDLSVPFLTIPLEEKDSQGGPPMPLLNINTKALTIFGTLMAISAFVLPLFVKKIPEPNHMNPAELHHHYRTNRGFDIQYFEDSINEILFRDSRITPCLQRIVCSAIATANRSENPTSVDKIIDGLFSHKWFEQAVNGTVVKDAVNDGRQVTEPEDCTNMYKGCTLNQQLITNLFQIVGI